MRITHYKIIVFKWKLNLIRIKMLLKNRYIENKINLKMEWNRATWFSMFRA